MRISFFNLLSILLLSLSSFYLHRATDKEEVLTLKEVSLINNPHIYSILKRIVGESRRSTSDKVYYLTVDLRNDSCGIRMEIVAHVKKNLSWYDGYSGYTEIQGLPVVFENNSQVELEEIPDRQGIFPMAGRYEPPIIYDPDVWLFILKENGYERYYDNRGWLWYQYDSQEVP